ncbi:MAG: beta-hydroxylase [Pirellulales bacterium]|nr:beta-hydroxylase [Pirellulales bacterium]
MASYLAELMSRLAAGAARLPEDLRQRHAAFLASAQNADGGFAGRQGASDLYYTSFALRGLALLGALDEGVAGRAQRFLRDRLDRALPGIEFLSLVFGAVLVEAARGLDVFADAGADRAQTTALLVDRYLRDDGGYAKTSGSPTSSTYHTFLAVACKRLVGAPLAETDRIVALIQSRRREDGGFVEIPQMRDSGTNPTCAAVAVLRQCGALDEATRRRCVRFLAEAQTAEGGLRANRRVPVADLLSTFTGLATLADLGGLAAVDLRAARRFVDSLNQPSGGYRGGVWDDATDVEYTFYGLGSHALLVDPAEAAGFPRGI